MSVGGTIMVRISYLFMIGAIAILMMGCSGGGDPVGGNPLADYGTILLKNTSSTPVMLVLDGNIVMWDEDTYIIVQPGDQFEYIICGPDVAPDGYFQVWLIDTNGTVLTEEETYYISAGLQLTLFYAG
jgi:hypothetical protein